MAWAAVCLAGLSAAAPSAGAGPSEQGTQIVFLGTGNPNPDPNHQGPCLAIIVHGQPYLVDCGPGLVRQASAAHAKGFAALSMDKLTRAFITHLHTDHTIGLPDLMFTPAVTGRKAGLTLVGPAGLGAMTRHIEEAWSEDLNVRLHGGEPSVPEAYKITVHEIHQDGLVYEDQNVKVRAFTVSHGKWLHAYGYRFETPDRVIVVSGDTTYCTNLIENAKGCDVLIHEAYSAEGLSRRTPDWRAYHSEYHTSGPDVGRIANEVRPKLLLLYHELPFGEPDGEILREVRSVYNGDVREAQDLAGY